jgi:predicted RND superfamily exporter protein
MEMDAAIVHALQHSGRSIAFNVMVFALGFLSLLASEFTPIIHLGALVALALSISGFMSLFLISLLAPVLIRGRFAQARPRDAHGEAPQQAMLLPGDVAG